MNAAIIARVSGDGQRENTSHERQLEMGRELAKTRGLSVVAEYKEVESGELILARTLNPESPIYKTLRMGERGEIQYVIFDIPDRVGRGDSAAVVRFLYKQANVTVLYANGPNDQESLTGYITERASDMVSGIERRLIRKRLTEGRWETARKGRIMATPFAPWGYRYTRQTDEQGRVISTGIEPDPTTAAAWLMGYRLIVEQGESLRGVARWLESNGVSTPTGRPHWRIGTLANIYRNPIYGGRWYYGRKQMRMVDTPKGKRYRLVKIRPKEEIVWIPVQGLITWDEWEKLQRIIDSNKNENLGRPSEYPYLLRGMIHCAECGSMMSPRPNRDKGSTKERHYYACIANQRRTNKQFCSEGTVRVEFADVDAWGAVIKLIEGGELDEPTDNATEPDGSTILAQRLAMLENQLKDLQQQQARLTDLYVRSGAITLAVFEDQERRINTSIKETTARAASVRAEIIANEDLKHETERLATLRETLLRDIQKSDEWDIDKKRDLLRAIGFRASWDKQTRRLKIETAYGVASCEIKLAYRSKG